MDMVLSSAYAGVGLANIVGGSSEWCLEDRDSGRPTVRSFSSSLNRAQCFFLK